jgi:hypothetical protein
MPFAGNNTTALSNNDGPVNTCTSAGGYYGVWFKFTTSANGDAAHQVDTCGSAIDTVITIYSNVTCQSDAVTPSGIQVACNDDYGSSGYTCTGGGSNFASAAPNLPLAPNTTYYVRVAAYGTGTTYQGNYNVLASETTSVGVCCSSTTGTCFGTATTCPTGSLAAGTSCTPFPCAPTGICCDNTTGACSLTYAGNACAATATAGTGTTCSPGTPSSSCAPSGICCNSTTGACTLIYGGACASGLVAGSGTTCGANSCPATSICCNTTSCACSVVYVGGACPSGTTTGTGTVCATTSCPGVGVCCNNTTGACTTLCSGACAAGTTAGTGTACTTGACPNTGACCYTYGSPDGCAAILSSTCTANGGTYLGDNVACTTGGCLPSLACGSTCAAGASCASNNGGFESGTLTGSWADTDPTYTSVPAAGATGPGGQVAHSGSYFLSTGPTVTPASEGISQTITANPGDIATITYWYSNDVGNAGSNEFKVVFDGVTLIDLINDTAHSAWTQFTFTATVMNPNPTLSFLAYNGPSWDAVDDISVCVAPGIGACCNIATGVCSSTTIANCGTGGNFLGGSCTPNPCPPPPGVCCRGATCNQGITVAANCTVSAGSAAGAQFALTLTGCNPAGNTTSPCCYADYDKMNGIQVADIFAMLNDWFAGKKYAVPGGDGSHGTLSVQNIFDFLNLWFAGGC